MTTPAGSATRPGRGWYVVAAALAAGAVAILLVLAVWIGRAVADYSITPFEQTGTATVTVGDRGVAIWVSPQDGVTACTSVNKVTGHLSFDESSDSMVTVTDGGHTWKRAGIVKGKPGSKHIVVCGDGHEQFGYADNPRISRYVAFGVTGGVVAGLAATAAFVIVLVVALKRSRKPLIA